MNNKKLIFIINSPRSGSTLLLSYLCGLPNTKILYETRKLIEERNLVEVANYFDSFNQEIVIEKTPEHVFHLDDIEKLRKICKRDIYVLYIVRPPIPTVLSILKAAKNNSEIWGEMDLLGACEKYEKALVEIYNNLISKRNEPNTSIVKKYVYGKDILENSVKISWYKDTAIIPYSFCIIYRELTENPYKTLEFLLNSLYIEADIQSLIDNRVENTLKVIPSINNEEHHENVLKTIEEVESLRDRNISKQIEEGISKRYRERFDYIRSYFEHPINKETIYDLVVSKKKLNKVEDPLVTIIVPLYNKEKYIEQTLTSILNQTYQNIRIIVVDDASTDKSKMIAKEFRKSLSVKNREKLEEINGHYGAKHKGVSSTRNLGIDIDQYLTNNLEESKSDIISFCDADDIWDSQLIEKSVETFKRYPYIDCVYSRVLDKRGDVVTKNKTKICNGDVFKDAIQYNFLGCGSNLFIKSEVIRENDIKFCTAYNVCEDWDFFIQLSQVATFKSTKEYLVTYRRLNDSLSSNKRDLVSIGKNILQTYVVDKVEFKRSFTRLFCYYLSFKNFTLNNIQDLDFKFIIRVIFNKFKSFVKSYISKTS